MKDVIREMRQAKELNSQKVSDYLARFSGQDFSSLSIVIKILAKFFVKLFFGDTFDDSDEEKKFTKKDFEKSEECLETLINSFQVGDNQSNLLNLYELLELVSRYKDKEDLKKSGIVKKIVDCGAGFCALFALKDNL
mmetsp:Transcript_33131/g.30050  ORF Transcript_33131/g.30050 Transcript_33131/m.30050 type:complete len:137 (-) Transcript_33131:665-1075(-)